MCWRRSKPGDHRGTEVCNQAPVMKLVCSAPRLSIPRRADAYSAVKATYCLKSVWISHFGRFVFIMC